jgi:HAD domain in Swiss Army Knife RNA repair proteins
MRVLFLDFDGVLHPGPDVTSKPTHWCWLPDLVELLAWHAEVRIVVHSLWRLDHSVDELRALLGELAERVIDATPQGGRLESIEAWLVGRPDIVSYRVLDDDEREFFYPLPAELIVCDPALGVTDPRARRQLLEWLDGGGTVRE